MLPCIISKLLKVNVECAGLYI